MKTNFLYLFIALAVLASAAFADAISTIELRNRPAEEVIPIVKPMLGPDDSISGQGFKLFLRASPETVEQVKQMIGSLDVAAKMVLISVFQGSDRDLRALGVSGNFNVQGNNGDVSIGTSGKRNGGADVSYSTRNASGGANIVSTRGRLQDNPIYTLRVTEGTEGYIETGKTIPYFSGEFWWGPRGGVPGVGSKDVTSGFYVLPRVHGEQVTMDVSPFKSKESKTRGGDINTQRARTTITGRMGEWIPVGGTTEQTQQSSSGIGSYSSTRSRDNESIWIKADLVN